MPVLRVQSFSGVVPVSGDRALPDNYATESVNTWLYGSELRGIRPPGELTAISATARRVLRIPRRTPGGMGTGFPVDMVPPPSYLGDSFWMQFDDKDTDIVKGQLVEDRFERYYFCSPSLGPRFNTYKRMVAGQSSYKLGVPGPDVVIAADGSNPDKPILSATGGAVPQVTRAWTYTWVNEFGEESAPALPATGTTNTGAVVTVSNIKDPPALGAEYPAYTKKRVYRTVTGQAVGSGDYYRVNEIPIGTLVYVDDTSVQTDSILVNKLTLESTNWLPPPDNLQGWIAMPNGFLIAFDKPIEEAPAGSGNWSGGNNIYMCESYHFHAWPPAYKQATETPVVGLGVLGQTCVVATQGYPATITGIKPATCAFTKATTGEPCLTRGSIVSTPQGVIYASQNGLQMVGPAGIENVTEKLITREEWINNFAPQFLRGVRYQNGYLALLDVPAPNPRSGFYLDPTELKVALTQLSEFDNVVALNLDFWSGEVLMIDSGYVVRWDSPPVSEPGSLLPVLWRSKEFQFTYEENFGVYAIYWDQARYVPNGIGVDVCPDADQVRLAVYANRRKVYDEKVPRNGRPVRLGSGFKADIWQFEIRARAPVYSLHVASTAKELKLV
jgi:hypothetical protein